MLLHRFAVTGLLLVLAAPPVAAEEEEAPARQPQSAAGEAPGEPKRVDFARDVRPILSDNCFQCHGPDPETREAGLRLDEAEEAQDERGGYPAVVPGDPEASELIARIEAEDEFMRMPPPEAGKELTAEEREVLRRWIAEGAAWSTHWAWRPPVRAAVPAVRDADWPDGPWDRFLLAALEENDLEPAAEADRVTLIRRLAFDLTGLPPTPEEVDRFLADRRPDAYRRLVDRLLARPEFGERMAMYWLDLVRYADTVGYHGDQEQPISPYRDYVIDALNEGRPYDQFTREQLAGDLLPDRTLEQWIASGYNRLLQTSHEGGVQPKEYLAIYAADRVRNVSGVWLGSTLGCAQCHDHKFDPFTSRDFYAMAAFFADVDEAQHFSVGTDTSPTKRPPEIDVLPAAVRDEAAEWDAEIERLERQIADLGESAGDDDSERLEELENELERARARRAALDDAARRTMVTVSIEPREMRVLPRGNWMDDSGPVVGPAVPAFLGQVDAGAARPNRLDLADWLTDPEQGAGRLTARVMANRLWYLMFGRGLSRSLDDFGGQGSPPTHPQLLDAVALDLVDGGWDWKRAIRRIALSRAYRQSSVADPATQAADPVNDWFSRQSRRRVPAETVRDTALASSGLLVRQIGGPSVRPYQPEGYYRHLNFPVRTYQHDRDARQWRRGVYVHWQRQFLHPMLKAFDAPTREECTAERPQSNTPLASLVLLNDPTFVEAARAMAARVMAFDAEDFDSRLTRAFRIVTSRRPSEAELERLAALWEAQRARYEEAPDEAEQLIGVGRAPRRSPGPAAEHAAWTDVARVLLNLGETYTRE